MKNIYAFENMADYIKYQKIIERFSKKLKEYQHLLEKKYKLSQIPKGVLWTTEELATSVLSDIPIPAYTNKDIITISPDIKAWRKLFVKQLEGLSLPHIHSFYNNLSENHIFTIVAHELTHHSDLFLDDFEDNRENSIWFEEGMCDYLSRKTILTEREFEEISNVESELVEVFKDKYGNHSLNEFGSDTYQGNLTSIMYDYWRSFLAVKFLVEVRANNNTHKIFEGYHNWDKEGRKRPLTEYFDLKNF